MKLFPPNAILIAFLSVASTRGIPAAEVLFDLQEQWSDATNPNGAWTYREGGSPLPSVNPWTWLGGSPPQPAWAPSNSGGNFLPGWFKFAQSLSSLDLSPGDVALHSTDYANGPGHGIANVVWTSPGPGTIRITGAAWPARSGRSNIWILSAQGAELTRGDLIGDGTCTRSKPCTFEKGSGGGTTLDGIRVRTGDQIELQIVRTTTYGDFVGVRLSIAWAPGRYFSRGDPNADGFIEVSDAIFLLVWLFLSGPEPPCADAADVNDDGGFQPDTSDAIYLLTWLFQNGPIPPAPGPWTCDSDPIEDGISCSSFPPCD